MSNVHLQADQLNAYLLGELGNEEAHLVAVHLGSCCACRDAEARLRDALAAYAGARSAPPRDHVLATLLAVQRSLGHRQRQRRAFGAKALGAIAAALAIFLCGFWAGRHDTDPGRSATEEIQRHGLPAASGQESTSQPPRVTFAVAVPDRVAGLAARDTTVR